MSCGRFDVNYGNWLPDCESVLVCECPNCGHEIYEGDGVVSYDGDFYCDESCLAEYLGATHMEAYLERDED